MKLSDAPPDDAASTVSLVVMRGSRRGLGALVLSFAVYLTPLVGPHAAWLLGEVVWRDLGLASGRGHREPLWVATDIAAAVATQLAFLLVLYWGLGKQGWLRGLAVAAAILPAMFVLNHVYMVTIPERFLVVPDTTPERLSWPPACTAPDVWMPPIPTPIFLGHAAPIWVAGTAPPNRYGLLDAATCAVRPLGLTFSGSGSVVYAAGGRALYLTTTPPTAGRAWFVVDVGSDRRWPLDVDENQFPILSTDGRFAAWLRPVAGSTPPIQLEAVIRAVEADALRVVDLSALGPGGLLQIVQFDAGTGELILARGLRQLSVIGTDGRLRKKLPTPTEVDPQPQTYRFLGEGWVAWDAYREDGPYRVAWALPTGSGVSRVPLGRSVTSLALSPDGRWIALSVTSGLSIGSTPDAVYVLRAGGGPEAFRRYFPKYTRASVAFAGDGLFVYSDLRGVNVVRIE